MGQQQHLLIILSVVLVGRALAVGISIFAAANVNSNKDAIINDLNILAANAYRFYIKPAQSGGGGGAYTGGPGFAIPPELQSDDNGSYTAVSTGQTVTFVGTSGRGYGTITAICDNSGRLTDFSYSGDFE